MYIINPPMRRHVRIQIRRVVFRKRIVSQFVSLFEFEMKRKRSQKQSEAKTKRRESKAKAKAKRKQSEARASSECASARQCE